MNFSEYDSGPNYPAQPPRSGWRPTECPKCGKDAGGARRARVNNPECGSCNAAWPAFATEAEARAYYGCPPPTTHSVLVVEKPPYGWMHVDCRGCGLAWSKARNVIISIKDPICGKCNTPWPWFKTEADALAALNQPTPCSQLTGHRAVQIIMDDPEPPTQPAPIDWFKLNAEIAGGSR